MSETAVPAAETTPEGPNSASGANSAPETRGFKAEVRELLKLMIHSLYSHREIFLRELISNASDANDKLRFLALGSPELLGEEKELAVWVTPDEKAGTVTIRDNGIGMTREEAVTHLGTIARSGTAEFFGKLTGDAQKDSQLIGQFGVGFYSAFIVAERVEVISRRAGEPAESAVRWSSAADGDFTVETVNHAQRGTTVILHLKDDAKEFADRWRLRTLVRRYSDHLAFPVFMPKTGEATLDYEAVNQARALWLRPRTEISDEEYTEFYRHISHDTEAPLAWSHNKVEGKREYTTLLYLPGRAPFDLWQRDAARGLKLYVKRVFIMDDAEQFLPLYLRFIKGVLDSSDLPLNVSRELLQKDPEVEAMKSALTKRALDLIAKFAKDDPDKYAQFWKEFGQVMKEGVAEDYANRDKLLPLLRFASTHEGGDEDKVSLADYVARMQPVQQKIYYVLAESRAGARSSPFIEQLRARRIEVLLLGDRVDPWIMGQLPEFEGKSFQDAARGDLDLAGIGGEETKAETPADDQADKALFERVAGVLGDAVAGVKASHRLTESPACLARKEDDMSEQMRRVLAAAGRGDLPPAKPELELNMAHPLVQRLAGLEGAEFGELAQLLFDQAQLTEQGQLANPGEYARRLNSLLLKLLGQQPGDVMPGTLQRVDLPGPAGRIEAVVELPRDAADPAAFIVVCHPHPLHGGTMDNKVVTTIARAAHQGGVASIRFNYRGVGASEGKYDDGRGETGDALTAVAHGRRLWPAAQLWLAGFSFGGCIALRCSTAPGAGRVDRLLTVAPALASHFGSPGEILVPGCPWLVVQGADDDVVDARQQSEWVASLRPAPEQLVLPGVGHYFHGALNTLQEHASRFFQGT